MKKTRMFKLCQEKRIPTVNPINGCLFNCYGGNCWAARMSRRLERMGVEGYENGFEPSFVPSRMKVPKNADIIWIGDMGDLAFQSTENIERIIKKMINPNPDKLFFLETKDPATYNRFIDKLPENVVLSTTIETNRNYHVSNAPSPEQRYHCFRDLAWNYKHVSIEPVMRFDMEIILNWMREIKPHIISIGYDNYNCDLPEPDPHEFYSLIEELEKFTYVEVKTRPEDLKRFIEFKRFIEYFQGDH